MYSIEFYDGTCTIVVTMTEVEEAEQNEPDNFAGYTELFD